MSRVVKESTLHRNIKKYAEDRGAYVVKVWGGGFQEGGIPDLIIAINGIFIGMEVKVGRGKPSLLQLDHILSINEAGAIGVVVWSMEEAARVIDVAVATEHNLDNGEYLKKARKMYNEF